MMLRTILHAIAELHHVSTFAIVDFCARNAAGVEGSSTLQHFTQQLHCLPPAKLHAMV